MRVRVSGYTKRITFSLLLLMHQSRKRKLNQFYSVCLFLIYFRDHEVMETGKISEEYTSPRASPRHKGIQSKRNFKRVCQPVLQFKARRHRKKEKVQKSMSARAPTQGA